MYQANRSKHYRLLSVVFFVLPYCTAIAAAEDDAFRLRANSLAVDTVTNDDIKTEINFGRDIAARVLGRIPVYDNQKLALYVNLVGHAIAMQSSRPELEFHFAVLDADFENAYSTPGGYVFITKGAIKKMKDESELAGVLAHEVAHISQKHIVKAFKIKGKDDSAMSGITRLVGGTQDTARVAFFQAVDQAVKILFETGFNHADELEADQVATLLLAQTGYDPTALVRYITRMNTQQTAANKTQKTHPPSKERIDAMTKLLTEEGLEKTNFKTGAGRFKQYSLE